MKDRLHTLIWKFTGWIPPHWSMRDNEARLRYWAALVNAGRHLEAGRVDHAITHIRKGLHGAD